MGAQVADDVAQALQAAQLSQAEGDELRPAAHHAESLALLVLSSLGVEFMSGKQVGQLPEDCGIMGHDLLPQSHSIRHGNVHVRATVTSPVLPSVTRG